MRVVLDSGRVIDLGTTEVTPTIGITDFSRKVTDEFGVTTIVPRNFTRRMSMRLAVPGPAADAVYRQLVDLRATPALFIADDRFTWLKTRGIIKDFEFAFATGDRSYYALSIDGLAESGGVTDTGVDPALSGRTSTYRLVDPIAVTDATLVSSTIAESDAPAWSASATYAAKATVIRGHRIYESLAGGNVGNDPAASTGKWLDTGPTNRWAMFDGALGTATIAPAAIEVVLKADAAVTALALLDTNAASIRVRATGYDRTAVTDGSGKAIFLDLAVPAGANITVTLTPAGPSSDRAWDDAGQWSDGGTWQDAQTANASSGDQRWDDGAQWMDAGVWRDSLAAGDGTVTVGTLLLGVVRGLGATENEPTAGITDYSRKEVDEFGELTIVPRAWSKKMAARTLIRNDAVDIVADRLAAVRARPALWIARTGTDSLTVYGYPKEWSIEIGKTVSKLSLSIEGMSKAAKLSSIGGGAVAWPDITDPAGTKPKDNADKTSENTSKDTNAVGGVPAADVTGRLKTLVEVTIPAIDAAGAAAGQRITEARAAADLALSTIESEVERVDGRIDNLSANGGYDDTAVNARITDERQLSLGRDAALGTRIDSVSASITTTDRDLRALVQTKETAAVDRENAISRRVDDLVAQGGGGSDGVDTVARSEIQRVEQAAVLGQQALASRTSIMEATTATTAGGVSTNSSFAIWPDAQALPTGWAYWANLLPVARIPRTDGGGGFAARMSSGAGIEAGLVQSPVAGFPGWYVMDADVELISGTYVGAGITIQGVPSLHFASEADINGDVSATRTGRRRFTKLIQLTATLTNWHAMNGWAGWGPPGNIADKVIVWYRCSLRLASDAEIKAGKADAALPGITARIKTTEDTLADLPNRYATAQRAANIEASVGAASGKIASLERVTSDGTLVTAQRADNIEASLNESRATVSQQAGVLAGLNGKSAAYVRIIADAGNGRAALSLWSDQYGGAWQLTGNGAIDGNLTINGTLTARAFNGASMAREASVPWSGYASPQSGQTISLFTLGLPSIPPTGRFIYEFTAVLTTNAGQSINGGMEGSKPVTIHYVDDGGGLFVQAADPQGNVYRARPNASDRVVATTDFAPSFAATIRRGTRNERVDGGDYVEYFVSATYTLTRLDLKVTWVAI